MTQFDAAHVEPGRAAHRYPDSGPLAVTKLSVGPYDNNVYVLADPLAGEALLVDAASDHERILEALGALWLVGVVTTHRHPDHSGALGEVLRATGAWSAAHPADAGELPVRPDRLLEDGATVTVGAAQVAVVHTPGHTPGSICLRLPSAHVLTGDALFPGGVGRTSGPDTFREALDSAERRLLSLPAETRISPGHGDDTWVGAELPQVEDWRARGW
ncbi:MAG TPA: MBL fold metallo-hydrolase [Actinomycetes bacterium]|nr:MBL fold metallo-hydrolase [Actinomycetes bacterium]